jgi:hypothetical protein
MQNYLFLFFLFLVSQFLMGQSAPRPIPLVPGEAHRLTNDLQVVFPLKCDDRGDVYFRFPSRGVYFDVARISSDGSQKATYRFSDDPDLKGASAQDFAIAEGGTIFELVQHQGYYVVEFSADGKIKSKMKLVSEAPLNLSQLAALPGGNFFVSGSLVGDKTGHNAGKPFNAIFDSSGNLIRKISFKNDAKASKSPKKPDWVGESNPGTYYGQTLLGSDGNLYVMRAVSPAIVYVLSPDGSLVRTLRIQTSTKDARPWALLMQGGELAVEFDIPDAKTDSDAIIRVVNARSGQAVVDYRTTRQISSVACYTRDGFTSIGSDEDMWPTIAQAAPE